MGLTVAVTGPTGEIGVSAVTALEQRDEVERVIGMARREFDPAAHGWTKAEYRRGDILDRDAVDDLVADADVVVHLAYVIMGSRAESRRVNLDGTRNVFAATVEAPRPRRLVYTSSVAAYGYHADNPSPLTEDVPTRGSAEHYYSAQKAECEQALRELTDGAELDVYVLRPCIVAGPKATALRDSMPWRQLADRAPAPLRAVLATAQGLLPLLPDPGVPLQLVHHDDVADAIALAATGAGAPGAYNLAADGTISLTDVAHATGTRSLRVPAATATAASALLARLPLVPAAAEWIHVARTPVLMDTRRARAQLGWRPAHSSADTLAAMVAGS
ncbi:NAD-dependent epimerase/dehydratase family protein [uncultured Jatrophihabitans sp.]|uniref:NAD-dependent epimerase/dehydratase family protein n=1 Tax=uncultured Jatrophihabitans sp. TaxID=1610747 RepID=UPI0035C96A4E